MSEIILFDFEEQAVRVVLRDGEPWFAAVDVCRVLEIANPSQAADRLDDDEVTLCQTEGNHRPMNFVSESGLFALILRSDKPNAKRLRKWVTSEVLPSIRRSGRFELPEAAPAEARLDDAMTPRDWLALIREARILGGGAAGRRMWARSPFPALTASAPAQVDPREALDCLDWLAGYAAAPVAVIRTGGDDATAEALARAGLRVLDRGVFVSNVAPCFSGTRWAGGGHRAPLLSLPGVMVDPVPRRLAGIQSRGIVVPFRAFAMEAQDAA